MAVDLSLIPQNRVAELVSKLSSIDSSISTINTNITTNNNNAVHKTGNETVAGNKTFSGTTTFNNGIISTAANSGIMITNPNYTQGTAPSSTQWGRIDFRDKNNVEMAQCLTGVDNNNRSFAALWVHSPKASDTSSKWMLTAQCDTNGNYSLVSGVTPATSDNSTKIATTAYVRNQNYVPQSSLTESKVVITTYQSGFAWYRVWSDGWCEQGDCVYTDVNGWQNATCTLLLPMKDTNYHVSITSSWGGNGDGASYYYANNYKTTTSFQTNVTNYSPSYGYSTWKASGYKA